MAKWKQCQLSLEGNKDCRTENEFLGSLASLLGVLGGVWVKFNKHLNEQNVPEIFQSGFKTLHNTESILTMSF